MKFKRCEDCEAISLVLTEGKKCAGSGVELEANSTDAAEEKHVPTIEKVGDILKVNVGSIDHPMEEDHYIEWIVVETKAGAMIKYLKPGMKPHADFNIAGEEVVAVYEFCNKHGLWKVTL